MDDFDWEDTGQPSAGGQQSTTGGQQARRNAQQFQNGGQQQLATGAPQHFTAGGQQQFMTAGQQQLRNVGQQQFHHGGQQQVSTGGQHFQGGQFVSRGPQNQLQSGGQQHHIGMQGGQQQPLTSSGFGSQQASTVQSVAGGQQLGGSQYGAVQPQYRHQPGGQPQHPMARQQAQGGQQFSSGFGAQHASGAQYVSAGQQGHFQSVGQQHAPMARQQQQQAPGGPQFPNGFGRQQPHAEQQPGNHSFDEGILGSDDEDGPDPSQFPSGQQMYSSNSFGQQRPASALPPRQQSSHSSFGQQTQAPQQYQSGQPQAMAGQQQPRKALGVGQQPLPVAAQFQSGARQQPVASQFQLGVQQHYTSGMPVASEQRAPSGTKASTHGQQMTPTAPQFQPGVRQHITGGQSSPVVPQFPNAPQSAYGQQSQGSQQFSAGGQQFQLFPGGFQPQGGHQGLGDQQHGQQDDQMDDEEYSDEEEDYEEYSEYEEDDEDQDQDADGDQEMGEGMVEDPLYQQTRDQIEQWQRQSNTNLTEEQKAQFAAYAAWKKQQGPITSKKRLAGLGDCDFAEDTMEGAVRAAKRPRVVEPESREFYKTAQKVYAYGPQNNPDLMDEDEDSSEELDGLALDAEILGLPAEFKGGLTGKTLSLAVTKPPPEHQALDPNFRLIESICSDFWLMIEITKHLSVKEIVRVYSVSRTFHDAVNSRFQSTIAAWAQHISPAGWKVNYWKLYGKYSIPDPAGKRWDNPGPVAFPRPAWAGPPRPLAMGKDVRRVPGFKYLAMLEQRERRTRDILACLARAGHRLPKTMHITLKKIWMLMDMSTCNMRRGFIHNPDLWTDRDLYNAQMFFVKLNLRFNEPIFGPNSTALAETFLGAREGLTPLWELLRRKAYLHPDDVLQRRIKYWVPEDFADHYMLIGQPYFGVHPWDLGREHKEGWGAGVIHLRRPDELVTEECVRREIDMKPHFLFMVFWGHVSWEKRLNLVPTEDEMYMSDDELPPLPKKGDFSPHGIYGRCGNVPFEYDNWQPKHAMKARWTTLKRAEKLAVIRDDNDEQLRGLPYEEVDDEDFWNDYNVHDPHHPKEKPENPEDEPEKAQNQPGRDDKVDDGADADDDDDDDASSVQSFFGPEIPNTWNITYPLFDGDEEEERDVIEKIEYEYVDEEPLELPETVTDPEVIANWDGMDPYLQKKVIDEENRLDGQDDKDNKTVYAVSREELDRVDPSLPMRDYDTLAQVKQGWQRHGGGGGGDAGQSSASASAPVQQQQQQHGGGGESGKPDYRYEYPGVTDPLLLSMLRKYDRFAPEEFRCDEDGDPAPGAGAGQDSDGDQNMDEEDEEDEEHDDEEGEGGSDDEEGGSSDGDGSLDFEGMGAAALMALGDEDYDDEELEFDTERYERFLERVGDDGGFRKHGGPAGEKKGKGKAKGKKAAKRAGRGAEEAHERDLDDDNGDDIPLPKYEFRKY